MNTQAVTLSVIIVNWNTRDLLTQCLQSVYDEGGALDLEVIVVDNASSDDSVATVKEQFPKVRLVVNQENVGFAKANNQALGICKGQYALLLNSDALVTPGAIQALLHLADARPQAGIVGAQLLNTDGSFQASHTPFPNLWQEFLILSGMGRMLHGYWHPSRGPQEDQGPQIVDYVEGACMLVRRKAFEEAGGLDQGYFMYAEEVDLCYTLREKGWQTWYQPAAKVIHHGGGSSHNRRTQREGDLYRSRVRFFRKHYGARTARLLELQIYGLTAIKLVVHGLLRLVSAGRYGRSVISLRQLAIKFKDIK